MNFKLPDIFEVERPPSIQLDGNDDLKKAFGVELGKGLEAFQAACNVVGNDTSKALFISQKWLIDPIVLGARDNYLKVVDTSNSLLDADQLAAKLLEMVEERNPTGHFYILSGKERLDALKLYAEVRNMIGKNSIDLSTHNTTFKQMIVKFVEPEKKEKIVDVDTNTEIINVPSPIKLKLVG